MGATLAPGTVLHGRYIIDAPIQTGHTSALYRGSDALAAAKVVLIRENADTSPEARARFEQEAQALARLEHPSLPVVLDRFEEPSGRQYLVVLGYAEPHLGAVVARRGALAEGEVLPWFDRLLDAVAHLHAQEPPILHGRITPARIVLTADGTPHLTGLLELEEAPDADASKAGLPFQAHEQLAGLADERTDVYGLGATLYALLTGNAPPDAKARAGGAELMPPRQIVKSISAETEAAILRAMALNPDDRFQGPAQMQRALERVGRPGVWSGAAAPDRMPRSRKWYLLPLAGMGVLIMLGAATLWHLARSGEGQRVALAPSPSATAAATATALPPSPAPSATATPMPTATQPATATPSRAPTATPTVATATPAPPTRTPTVRWIAGPKPSATPRWFPPPTLVYPSEGAWLIGGVEFRWSWPCALADDEYFDLQVYRIGMVPKGIAWCKEPYYRTTGLLLGEGQYLWRVQIIRGRAGIVEGVVSDPSPARGFTWRATPASP